MNSMMSMYSESLSIKGTEYTGLYGFVAKSLYRAIFPDRDKGKEVFFQGSRQINSLSRRYYEHQLGAGMGPSPSLEEFFGYTEPIRRLVQREEPTPQANEIPNTMPSWLPGDDYLINFRKGDPFSKIDQGYARLPGSGYEAIHPELKDVKPENYTRCLRPVPHKKSRAPAREAALLFPRFPLFHYPAVPLPSAPLPRRPVLAITLELRRSPLCSTPFLCRVVVSIADCSLLFWMPPEPSHSLAACALWDPEPTSRIRSCRLLDYWISGSLDPLSPCSAVLFACLPVAGIRFYRSCISFRQENGVFVAALLPAPLLWPGPP